MALSDEDKKEVEGLITHAFDVPEGKTLTEHLAAQAAEQANAVVNGWDKRTSKERSGLADQVKQIGEAIEGLKKGAGDGGEGGGGDPPTGGDGDQLPPEMKKQFDALTKKSQDLEKRLEDERKAREESEAERKKVEDEAAAARQRDEVQRVALSKEIGVDPERVGFLLDHLKGHELVRARDGASGYELQTGTDKYSGDPVWKPLDDGLKEFVKGPGKMFLPAVPGAGGGGEVPAGGGGGSGGGARELSADDLSNMSSDDIEKAAQEGRLQIPG
ncbi:MAG: hypothetical protein ACYTFI_21150 [Planctomycetota bacterium]